MSPLSIVMVATLALGAGLNAFQIYDNHGVIQETKAKVEKIFNICKNNSCYLNIKTDKGVFTLSSGIGSGISESEYMDIASSLKEGNSYTFTTQGKEYHPMYLSFVPKVYPSITQIKP